MRRGVGHFVKGGYGGATKAAQRLGGTAATAGVLYSVLSPPAPGAAAESVRLDRTLLTGKSADEIMNAVVEAARPVDGTQDGEASRASVKNALSELLTRFPNASLLDLTEEQRFFAIERFVALDIFRRFCLDLEVTIQEKAPSVPTALSRLKEVRDYIKETVAAQFKTLNRASITAAQLPSLVMEALKETLTVFEAYAK